jgi:D-aminopeptidase
VNGRPLAEVELFAASLAPFHIRPILFSGCPLACAQARRRIPGIRTVAIAKNALPEMLDKKHWRRILAREAVNALHASPPFPYTPKGPFRVVIRIRDGAKAAARMADPWGFQRCDATIFFQTPDIHNLYDNLIHLCYLSPLAHKLQPLSLALFNLMGILGRQWVRYRLRQTSDH